MQGNIRSFFIRYHLNRQTNIESMMILAYNIDEAKQQLMNELASTDVVIISCIEC
jgi:hypothetical protein